MNEIWIKISTEQRPTLIAEGGEESLTLAQKQDAVGGLIEYCTFGRNVQLPIPNPSGEGFIFATVLDVIANEEGRLKAEPQQNAIGTYCAFGVPIFEAPYMIVGDVLVHVRVDEYPEVATQSDILGLVMGIDAMRSHMMPSLVLDEADYDMEGDLE